MIGRISSMRFATNSTLIVTLALAAAAQQSTQQAPQPPATTRPRQEPSQPAPFFEDEPYIRRFTIGGNASILVLGLIKGGDQSESISSPPLQIDSKNENKGTLFGGGVSMQFFFTDRYAINADLQLRRPRYKLSTTFLEGVDNPNTVGDDRIATFYTEDTRARYWDLPLLVRRYNESRFEDRRKWFIEAGPVLRRVTGIRSSTEKEFKNVKTCCDETPATPAHRNIFGAVVGAGLVLKDDFGIKLIPEFRYTRWFGGIFNNRAAQSRRDQYEILFSITF
ncbi:MAG: outer membrane beta-barrel protein [Bryobacteraceae bacterium]